MKLALPMNSSSWACGSSGKSRFRSFIGTSSWTVGFARTCWSKDEWSVELKCKEALHPVDHAQLLSHMRLLNVTVGLLINFHVMMLKDGITRMVNNYQESSIAENTENCCGEHGENLE
jgi:hypothetical protein